MTRQRSRIARALSRVWSIDLADAVVVLVIGIATVALVNAILHQRVDYDELEHFHAAWLIRKGVKPFKDFFECHPPFLWYPLSLFFRVFGNSYKLLIVFRFITALGHVVFMAGVLKNAALSLRQLPTPVALPARTAALVAAFIALHPAIFEYFIEFRIDPWPNAILVFAIYRYRTRLRGPFRSSVELAALSMAAVLCSPKLVVFAALFAFISLVMDDQRLVRAAGMLVGGVGGLALGAGWLLIAGVNPIAAYRLSLLYHHALNTKGGFDQGLYDTVWGHSVARKVLIASVIAWPLVAWRRMHRAGFEFAVLLFLALQLKLVNFHYKQYYSPWYLLAIAFLPYLEVFTRRFKLVHSLMLAGAVLYAGANALENDRSYQTPQLSADLKAREALELLVPPGRIIVGSVEAMPVFHRNAFYQNVNSLAPSGYDGARVMQDLKIEPYSSEFTTKKALADMEARRPDLIMLGGSFPRYARQAIEEYVKAHEAEFTRQESPFGQVLVRKPKP